MLLKISESQVSCYVTFAAISATSLLPADLFIQISGEMRRDLLAEEEEEEDLWIKHRLFSSRKKAIYFFPLCCLKQQQQKQQRDLINHLYKKR